MKMKLRRLPPHNPTIWNRHYSNNRDRPLQWYIKKDGNINPVRFYDEEIVRIKRNFSHLEKAKASITQLLKDVQEGRVGMSDKSKKHFKERLEIIDRKMKGGTRPIELQREQHRKYHTLRLAELAHDNFSLLYLKAEFEHTEAIPISLALIEEIEDRYDLDLPYVRANLCTNDLPSDEQDQTHIAEEVVDLREENEEMARECSRLRAKTIAQEQTLDELEGQLRRIIKTIDSLSSETLSCGSSVPVKVES